MQGTAAGPGRVVKPLAEAPLLGGKSCCSPRTPQRPPPHPSETPGLARPSPSCPARARPPRLLLGAPCLLQATPPLPLRLHRQHFEDLIMR